MQNNTLTLPKSILFLEAKKTAALGSTCEIVLRYQDFALFWRENPLLGRFALQSQARSLLPQERVKNCLRVRANAQKDVEVIKPLGLNSAHFGNLQTCASVWHCPICSAKIATRRREELTTAIAKWTDQGNRILLATFTLQHLITDPCAEVLNAITKAHHRFWADRKGQALRQVYGIAGKIRGLEVTYTPNGWHWHFHVLLFIEGELSPNVVDELRDRMSEHWQHVVAKVGRFADGQHGLNIKSTDQDVADYVSKYGKEGEGTWRKQAESWTEAHEIAMAPIKRAAKSGLTPYQLLAMSLAGDERAGAIFQEFAGVVKGKRQLSWSKGLRQIIGLTDPELSDEEIAAKQDQAAGMLASLAGDQWHILVANDARGDLLKVAASGEPGPVRSFLAELGITDVHFPGEISPDIPD